MCLIAFIDNPPLSSLRRTPAVRADDVHRGACLVRLVRLVITVAHFPSVQVAMSDPLGVPPDLTIPPIPHRHDSHANVSKDRETGVPQDAGFYSHYTGGLFNFFGDSTVGLESLSKFLSQCLFRVWVHSNHQ